MDNRITVLNDASSRYWPIITKMSVEEAEMLHQQLAGAVANTRAENKTESNTTPVSPVLGGQPT